MGYTTEFEGEFKLSKPLKPEHAAYLKAFSDTRRMKRDAAKAEKLPDPVRVAAGLPIGNDGAYFVGGGGLAGQDRDVSVLEYNYQPPEQPGLWRQWEPNDVGDAIRWSGTEKFYDYVEWLQYLQDHFLGPWGYELSGSVTWQGEEGSDFGTISIGGREIVAREGAQVGDGRVTRLTVDLPTKLLADYRSGDVDAEAIADKVAEAWEAGRT